MVTSNMRFLPIRSWVVAATASLTLMTVVPVFIGPQAAASPAKAEKFMSDGDIRFERKDYRGALIQFENANREDPKNTRALFRMGETLIELQDYKRAETMLALVQKKTPTLLSQRKLAEAIYFQRRLDDALKVLNSLSEDPLDRSLMSIIRADRMLNSGSYEEALKEAGKAVRVVDYADLAHLVQAKALYGLGDVAQSQDLLDRVLSRNGRSFQAILLKSRIALKSGDFSRAIDTAQFILATKPGNVSAGSIVVEAYIKAGNFSAAKKAIAALQPTVKHDPRPNYLRVLLALAQGDTNTASLYAAEISEWLRGLPYGPALIARLHYENKNYVRAEKVLRDYLIGQPKDVEARILLARTYYVQDRFEPLTELLTASLLVSDKDPTLLQIKADMLVKQRKHNEAMEIYHQLALAGGQAGAKAKVTLSLAGLGEGEAGAGHLDESGFAANTMSMMAALTSGNSAAAIRAGEQAVAGDTKSPLAYNLLAGAYIQAADEASARKALGRALEIDPGYVAAIVNLARLDMRNGEAGALERRLKEAARKVGDTRYLDLQLIDLYIATGRRDDALAIARTANMAAPGDIALAQNAAALLIEKGYNQEASEIAARLVAKAPRVDRDVARTAAGIYLQIDLPVRATQALMRVLGRENDLTLEPLLVQALVAAGRSDDAIDRLRRTLRDQPRNLDLREEIASLLAKNGKLADGLRMASEIRKFDQVRGLLVEARMRDEVGQIQSAVALLRKAARTNRDGRVSRRLFVVEQKASNDPEVRAAALAQLAKWVDANPQDSASAVLLGNTYLEAGDLQAADKALTKALTARRYDPVVLNNLAWTRYRLGRAGAEGLAKRAYLINPNDPQIIDTYGVTLTKPGSLKDAVRLLREALARAPQDKAIEQHLAAAQIALNGGR